MKKTHSGIDRFLLSLGFPRINIHESLGHFDFSLPSRRILVIGPMGAGKTEYSARVWRDAKVALTKTDKIAAKTSSGGADRRNIFFIRSILDRARFTNYPQDALAFRGGYERCGERIAFINGSEDLEMLIEENQHIGTWIIDEATFYDERLAYVVKEQSVTRGLVFIFPALVLNFRKEIFNQSAKLLLETATDVFPLTAYCEHPDCLNESLYTYRYYIINGKECPALYFDPLIIIGGDVKKDDPMWPNYCTRCETHHYLPGKEYTYLVLKLFGEKASKGDTAPLENELYQLKNEISGSLLYKQIEKANKDIFLNALKVSNIAEKALIYLFLEQNLITEELLKRLIKNLNLDKQYIKGVLRDNRRPVNIDQQDLPF